MMMPPGFFEMVYSVMSHKNVIKIVWYILVQLSSLNNTMSLVSGAGCQVSEKDDRMRILIILNVIRFLTLTPDT
jgi:DNA relaxase NicK